MPTLDDPLRVAMLGGVPPALGGGGLERQIACTTAALRERGLEVRDARDAAPDWQFDVLHVFGHTADVGHALHHWRRQPSHLVVTPVVVVPQRRVWRLRLATRLPIPAFEPRLLRALATRADRLIACSQWEAGLLRKIGGSSTASIETVDNGADRGAPPLPRAELEARMSVGLPERYVIVVGAISPRKRQAEIAQALRGVCPLVAVGGWNGPGGRKEHFAQAVQETGGQWLGEIHQRSELNGLISGADALVHLSEAEGQSLAVMEALSLGTRCLLSDIPQQIELAERWPDQISIVGGVDEVVDALRSPVQSTFTPAEIPTWDEVAADLEMIYESIEAPKLLWDERS